MCKRYIYVFLIIFLNSCVSNSDLNIINTKNENKNIPSFNFNYKLKKGDLISVQISSLTPMEYDFFNKESGSNSQLYVTNPFLYGYLVDDQGALNLPVLGSFTVEGLNLVEAQALSQKTSERFFSEPSVRLNILNYYITVLGEVNNPGRISLNEPNINLLEVFGICGDLTKIANRKKIKIIRSENDITKVYFVDLRDKDLISSENFYVQPNDIIYVEPTSKRFVLFDDLPAVISTLFSGVTLFYLIQQK